MPRGLILTDIEKLSSILGVKSDDLVSVVQSFITSCSSYCEWSLVDASDPMYASPQKEQDWKDISAILSDHYIGMGLSQEGSCPLFIIGGHEVIPMPPIQNPLKGGTGHELLYTDMLYCFDPEAENTPSIFLRQEPKYVVGRLPLSTDHHLSDLTFYLDGCVKYLQAGIPIRGASMTTTESWLPASTMIMEDIPTVTLSADKVPLNNRMVVSPLLDTDIREDYEGYVHELEKMDFLVCNLHGTDEKDFPMFNGEDTSGNFKPCAVQPSMFSQACPLVINTVACYGGRFIGYHIDESMLYSALFNGTLLYTGSGETALGGGKKKGGCSELMLRLYNIYLLQGQPAGAALMKAKRDYYNTCHTDDEDELAMFTILEFNLFGCPLLHVQPKMSLDYKPILLGHRVQENVTSGYSPKQFLPVSCGAYEAEDIHAYVRELVDNNLSIIRLKIEQEVYQRLGLSRHNIRSILKVMQDGIQKEWCFVYQRNMEQTNRSTNYLVRADMQGNINRIIHTK